MEDNSLKRKREELEEAIPSKRCKYYLDQSSKPTQMAHGVAHWSQGSREYYFDVYREIVAYYDSDRKSYVYTISDDDEAFTYNFDPSMFYLLKNRFEGKKS